MSDENKTKNELIKELANLRKQVSVLETVQSHCTKALEELQVSEKRFKDIAENAMEWIWEVDQSGRYTYSSPVVEKILGYKPAELMNKHFYDLFHPDDREELKTAAFDQFHQKKPFREFINRNVHKNGQTVWLSTSGVPIIDASGDFMGYRGADTDITDIKNMVESLRESEEVCHMVTQTATDAVILIDNSEMIRMWNSAAENMFGYSAHEAIGKPITIIIPERLRATHKKGIKKYYGKEKSITMGGGFEIMALRKDGSEFPIEISLSSWERRGKRYYTGIIHDMTEWKKLEKKLLDASITDPLTELLNRRGFLTLARKQIEIANRRKTNLSILYLDLNDMKTINDEFGHKEGDQALVDVANALKRSFRASDIIARIGGDEFIVLIVDTRKSYVEKAVIDTIQDNLRRYNEEGERGYKLSVSTGIVDYDPDHPSTLDELIARADELMYENKQRYQFEKAGLKYTKKVTRENRIGKRFNIASTYKAELVLPDYATISNIGMNGICLETRQRLTKNAVYSIRMLSGNNNTPEFSLTGLVVWTSLRGNSTEQHAEVTYYQNGLRFIGIDDRTKNLLKKFVADF